MKCMKDSSTGQKHRLVSIDALRGLVMLLMLIDHVRETIYLHMQVSDPVDVTTTDPLLIFLRFLSSFCAPTFVLLTGMGAYLYSQRHTIGETSRFLLKRGLFLMVLEVTVIGFAWTGVFPPEKLYLQVIWCIGICMVTLAGLIHLPRLAQVILSLTIIAGHNLLDGIQLDESHFFYRPWAMLHQKEWISLFGIPARTTYPVLPWIGIILGGFILGRWFTHVPQAQLRQRFFLRLSGFLFIFFLVVRGANFYGDYPWQAHDRLTYTFMEFFWCLTKYPPSLLFTTLTLSFSIGALALFERCGGRPSVQGLATFGKGAMFFYVLHLYVLKAIYLVLLHTYGANKGSYYGVDYPYQIIVWVAVLIPPLWWTTLKFVKFKRSHRDWRVLRYF